VDYSGTGLGLAICERAVTRHGGRIWVSDTTEAGTRISFTLPTG
jgi:signal transduction histidine kinase